MKNNIELISIEELVGMNFFIPSYQRGYRWTKQQVKDLLNDIEEYITNGKKGIYCIQPLVVKGIPKDNAIGNIALMFSNGKVPSIDEIQEEMKVVKWEVIDGQQRLTTIKILLSFLEAESYDLEYQTRKDSNIFLNEISHKSLSDAAGNIDFYHMHQAYATISDWFFKKDDFKTNFLEALKKDVQFIWYETKENDPIKVFTRLNIGKIALTDSELIKALFLNESNFKSQQQETIRLQQVEIANEWDSIEYTLHDEEFWLFIQNSLNYNKPTRIDYILDSIRKYDRFGLRSLIQAHYPNFDKTQIGEKYNELIGNDEHKTFRYFYNYFEQNKKAINAKWLRDTWLKIKKYFQIFEEWYNDLEMYHYVGYLVERDEKIEDIVKAYTGDKASFMVYVKEKIREKIRGCNNLLKEYEKGKPKRACYPLLLLYNIQTVIAQNSELKRSKYGMSIFYKFPFHLLKNENWDMEHIDSNTTNPLKGLNDQKEWLKDCLIEISESDKELKQSIKEFIAHAENSDNFDDIVLRIDNVISTNIERLKEPQKEDDTNEKNLIWNYCLLDSGTNKSYGNAIFPAKRRKIIQKDKGENGVSFVPPCTKNVFLKYYNQQTNVLRAWDRQDAFAYLWDIEQVLMEFLYKDIYSIPKDKRRAMSNKKRLICKINPGVKNRYLMMCKSINSKNNEK